MRVGRWRTPLPNERFAVDARWATVAYAWYGRVSERSELVQNSALRALIATTDREQAGPFATDG